VPDEVRQPTIKVAVVGAERQPVAVIDNFSPDPDRLVSEAEKLDFKTRGDFYPGPRAPVTPVYFEGLSWVIAPALRQVFGLSESAKFERAYYSLATTPPDRLSLAQRIPHIDGLEDGAIAIVHFLTRRDLGGTAFYRHRSTGFETVDAARREIYLEALRADFVRHGRPPPAYISGDTPIFEQIAKIPPAFNRALIYRSSLLHCADLPSDVGLPPEPLSGRLTVACFLSVR
jgi:hypothetical protein